MSDRPTISLNQQLSAVMEVLQSRRAGYPKKVFSGKLRQAEADYRIAQIEAVCDTLLALVQAESRAGRPSTGDFNPSGKAEIERAARQLIDQGQTVSGGRDRP